MDKVVNKLDLDEFKTFVGKKFFTVKFKKVDGSSRIMNCSFNLPPTSSIHPSSATLKRVATLRSKGMLTVLETKTRAIKTINLDKCIYVKANGRKFVKAGDYFVETSSKLIDKLS